MTVLRLFRREPTGRHALGPAVTAIPSGPPPAAQVSLFSPARPDVPVTSVPTPPLPVVPVQQLATSADELLPPAPEPVQVDVSALVPTQARPAEPVIDSAPGTGPDAGPAVDVPVQVLPVGELLVGAPPVQAVPAQAPAPDLDAAREELAALLAVASVVQAPTPPAPDTPPPPGVAEPSAEPWPEPATALQAAAEPPGAPAETPGAPAEPFAAPASLGVTAELPAGPPVPSAASRGSGPRVEFGFSDGTYRMLDPESETALALSELVGELTGGSPGRVTPDSPPRGSARP